MAIKGKRKKVKRKVSKKKVIKRKPKKKGIAKVGGISLLEELEKRVKDDREYSHKEEERIQNEVKKPANWFRSVQREECVVPSHIWHINKERIYDNYSHRYYKTFDNHGNEIKNKEKPKGDYLRIMSEQTLVLPDGKVITPIRQYCEHKVLPAGTREAYFYNFSNVVFPEVKEGEEPVISQPRITATRAEADPTGTRIDIGYQDVEETPVDIMIASNKSFVLESIHDENKEVLTRCFDYATLPEGHWVNGNDGREITDDDDFKDTDRLTMKGILHAKGKIQDEGLDDSNLILYTTGKGIRDLIMDPELDSYIGFSKPAIITESTVERILGVNLVRSGSIPEIKKRVLEESPAKETRFQRFTRVLLFKKKPTVNILKEIVVGSHACLFIPNITFGLVTSELLTMEAQRRNERQVVQLTGTQKVKSVLKIPESAVRISHA